MAIFMMLGVSTNTFANTNDSLSEEDIKNIAIEFSEHSLSDFSDESSDYLIDKNAVELKQFLNDKRRKTWTKIKFS